MPSLSAPLTKAKPIVSLSPGVRWARYVIPDVPASASLPGIPFLDMPYATGRVIAVRAVTDSDDYDLTFVPELDINANQQGFTLPLGEMMTAFEATGVNKVFNSGDISVPITSGGHAKAHAFLTANSGGAPFDAVKVWTPNGRGTSLWVIPSDAPNRVLRASSDVVGDLIVQLPTGDSQAAPLTGPSTFTLTEPSSGTLRIAYDGSDWDLADVDTEFSADGCYVKLTGFGDSTDGVYLISAVDDGSNYIEVLKTSPVLDTFDEADVTVEFFSAVEVQTQPMVEVINAAKKDSNGTLAGFIAERPLGLSTDPGDPFLLANLLVGADAVGGSNGSMEFAFLCFMLLANSSGSLATGIGTLDVFMEGI